MIKAAVEENIPGGSNLLIYKTIRHVSVPLNKFTWSSKYLDENKKYKKLLSN